MAVFNNWDKVTDGWYIVCDSNKIKRNQVKSFDINEKHIAVFRDDHGVLTALDGYCSHMGVDLGIGKVVDNKLRCYFHHWSYDQSGKCVHIPAQKEIPKKACLKTFRTQEKYGLIWVNPCQDVQSSVPEVPELENEKQLYRVGASYIRSCHYHITMINGIDPQHLSTVHGIDMNMNLEFKQINESTIDLQLAGRVPENSFLEKLTSILIGKNYVYSMRYFSACVATLSTMKNTKLFNKYSVYPTMHMIFAYQKIKNGQSKVTPIFVTKKRKGLHGWLISQFCLIITLIAFKALQGEDGEVYENIKFHAGNLLPIDQPIAKYIRYVNGLSVSDWSRVES